MELVSSNISKHDLEWYQVVGVLYFENNAQTYLEFMCKMSCTVFQHDSTWVKLLY